MMFETRKILGDESIAINVTCARVPVRNCHSESVTLQTREPLSVEEARELLEGDARADDGRRPGQPRATRRRSARPATTTCSSAGSGATRRTSAGCCLWVVSDNLLKGAATNAVQIAEVLHERGLIRSHAALCSLRRRSWVSHPITRPWGYNEREGAGERPLSLQGREATSRRSLSPARRPRRPRSTSR